METWNASSTSLGSYRGEAACISPTEQQRLLSFGWLVDFIVGSLIWSVAIVLAAFLAPFALIAFFAWQIFYNADRFFHLWLPLTPTAIWMMLTDPDPVGRILIGVPLAIIGWWIFCWWLKRRLNRYVARFIGRCGILGMRDIDGERRPKFRLASSEAW